MTAIEQIQDYIEEKMSGDSTGHDYFHVQRVLNNALLINKSEKADEDIITLTCLLHDIGDYKLTGDPATEYTIPKAIMEQFEVPVDIQEKVLKNISELSYKGSHRVPTNLEGRIAQDADRLDAIGAIGVARVFRYGGATGRMMWNPEIAPREKFEDPIEYAKYMNSSLDHFDEKLFKLKDLMNTETAKKIAEGRDAFLHEFYDRFKKEWKGEL